MDRGAWQATVHGVTKSWTRLRNSHSRHNLRKIYLFSNKEKRSEREVVVDGERGARDKYGALCHPTLKLHLKSWVSKTDLGQSKGESWESSEIHWLSHVEDFSGGASGKAPSCQCRRHNRCGFHPWIQRIPWRRAWQPTPVLHGQRSLAGYTMHRITKSQTGMKWLSTTQQHITRTQ